MYLQHTREGETNLDEYYQTLKEIDKNMQETKQEYQISGITAGMDAQVEVKPHQEPFFVEAQECLDATRQKFGELDSKFEALLMELISKYEVKVANAFCKDWAPTRAETNKLNFWEQDEKQLPKWKIIDFVAVPIGWITRSTVARNCRAQNLTDHWPVVTYVRLPQKKETWIYKNNSVLKGWRPKTESDEAGFGRMIVESLEDAAGLMGDICIEGMIEGG